VFAGLTFSVVLWEEDSTHSPLIKLRYVSIGNYLDDPAGNFSADGRATAAVAVRVL
jgi:hypothetical protein